MAVKCETAFLDFPCNAATVWQTLCDSNSYEKWYGFPNPRSVVSIEPDFSLGAKLNFANVRGSTVITVFELFTALSLSTGIKNDEITISETDTGCRLSLTTSLNGSLGWNGTDKAKTKTNKEILRQLRTIVCSDHAFESEVLELPIETKERGLIASVASNMFYGYKNPLKLQKPTAFDNSDSFSTIIDNTESDIVIHLRAAIAGLALFVMFFTALFVCVGFERSDIVPSSGLSVVLSDKVTKDNAYKIYIGQSKNELEIMLSCRGTRLSSNEYAYYSTEKLISGKSRYHVFVTFDAYGGVRRFGYVDMLRSNEGLGVEIANYRFILQHTMSVSQIETTIGTKLSAFWYDKSSTLTLFFGTLDTNREIFDPTLTSELVLKRSDSSEIITAQYYYQYDPKNTLPVDNLNKQFKRQYSNTSYYLSDRAAYERIFIIANKTRSQVDAILGTEGVEYATTYNSGIICSYSCRSSVDDEASYRYCYNVTFGPDNVATAVTMQNTYLESRTGILLDYDSYAIYVGTTLNELYSTMSLLPTYTVYDGDDLILCYGQRGEGYASIPYLYNLTVVLDAETLVVTDHSFNH